MENFPAKETDNNTESTANKLLNSAYTDEFEDLKKEAEDLDKLYNESKSLMSTLLNARMRGSLSFTAAQTANLIAIKNTKLAVLKQRMSVKDTIVKNAIIAQKLGSSTEQDIPVDKILEVLRSNDVYINPVKTEATTETEEEIDKAIDAELKGDTTPVSCEAPEPKECDPPQAPEQDFQGQQDVKDIPLKTDEYEVVSAEDGTIFAMDLINSTEEDTKFLTLSSLGFDEKERAVIKPSESGIPKAYVRGKEVEIVSIDET